VAEFPPHHSMSLVVIGSKNSGLNFEYGELLCSLPGALAAALLAPLAGYSRWVALAFTVPIANLYFGWIIGRRAGAANASHAPVPFWFSDGPAPAQPSADMDQSGRAWKKR
jgi:hypothetical protein